MKRIATLLLALLLTGMAVTACAANFYLIEDSNTRELTRE